MQELQINGYICMNHEKEKNNLKTIPLVLNNKRDWTEEELNQLIQLNKNYPHNWKYISNIIKTKTPIQCSYKMTKIDSLISHPK